VVVAQPDSHGDHRGKDARGGHHGDYSSAVTATAAGDDGIRIDRHGWDIDPVEKVADLR